MKKSIFCSVLLLSVLVVTGCSKKQQNLDTSQATLTKDTIQVNNTMCAFSGSQMKKEDLGKWTNTVPYTGTNPKFQGKKFVFNQCCPMCLKKFPSKWHKSEDEILEEHGIN